MLGLKELTYQVTDLIGKKSDASKWADFMEQLNFTFTTLQYLIIRSQIKATSVRT